jgi:Xaa-Pro aminopeptidase
MLTEAGCQSRRQRLQRELASRRWDLFVTGNYRTAYYFTGKLAGPEQPVLFLLWQDGTHQLLQPETYSIHRVIDRPFHDLVLLLDFALGAKPAPVTCAIERSATLGLYEQRFRNVVDATQTVLRLRKQKESDEVNEIRESLHLSATAYRAARQTITPGITEVDVYNAMYSAITTEAGTPVAFPGDFAAGCRCIRAGGPPTSHTLEPGDLYILDLFPAPALYFGDVCRAFAVGPPSDLQLQAWEVVCKALALGESMVRPGVRGRDVYQRIKEYLDSHAFAENSFWHHAGHGIGHHGHEAPRLIPGSDDVFEVGDVFTLEPGVYSQALRGGIRLENNYQVTESGVANLFDFPLEL